MGTTWITIAKVAGPLVEAVEQRFRRWAESDTNDQFVAGKAMVPEDENPRVADPAVVAEMVALVADLERHATAPPVVYFARYVDPWTTAASLCLTQELTGIRLVLSAELDLAFVRLAELTEFKRSIEKSLRAKDRTTRFSSFETYQFTNQLSNCLSSWETLLEDQGVETAVVLAFRAVGGCWLDEEVEASAHST